MYHYVRNISQSKYPSIKGLEVDGFRRQLDFLTENYSMVTAEQVIDHVTSGEPLPERPCLLTFDDGYKDHLDHVMPELLSRGLRGAFFPPVKPVVERELLDVNRVHFILAARAHDVGALVAELDALVIERGIPLEQLKSLRDEYGRPSRYDPGEVIYVKRMLQHALPEALRNEIARILFSRHVGMPEGDFAEELYLSMDDVKLIIGAGMYIGSHGYRHLWLNREARKSQAFEIDASLEFLKQVGARTEDWMMCYPYGGYNEDTLAILAERRCAVGLTTRVGMAEIKRGQSFELARYDTNDFPQ